jgi:hypothetical protein
VKQKAELIYFASVDELSNDGFDFRKYNGLVLDGWADWDGHGDPSR